MIDRVILIADDDPTDREFFAQALQKACSTVRIFEVKDGEEAIDYLAGNGKYADREAYPFPSYLVLDLKMPRRSGLEVLEWLRVNLATRALPVTVLTGSGLQGDRDRVEKLGADYQVKPVEYSALEDIARNLCIRAGFV